MDVETITKLLDAGYTKNEIDAMQSAGAPAETSGAAVGAPAESAGEEQSNAGAENAGKVETNVDINAAIEALNNTVAGLQETIRAMQTKNAESVKGGKAKDSVNDVMKSFIENL